MPDNLSIQVTVDPKDISQFTGSGYVLCLAKSVKEDNEEKIGNVVFTTIPNDKLAPDMSISWTEKYQCYLTQNFQVGSKVSVGTKQYEIDPGQTAKFKTGGDADVGGPTLPGQPLIVVNEWKDWARVGVQVINDSENPPVFRTIYISTPNPIKATSKLTPIKKFQIFWAKNLTTDTMIDNTTTPYYQFDLTNKPTVNLSYQGGNWSSS